MQEENEINLQKFSARLKGLRARRGLSQGDLAAKLAVSPGSVGNWESGQNMPGPAQLRKLAEFFEVQIEFFYGEAAVYPQIKAGATEVTERKSGEEYYYRSERNLDETSCPDAARYVQEWFGDSMEPKFQTGDLLVISPNSKLENGDLVIAKGTDETLLFRVFHRRTNGRVVLTAYNAEVYPLLEFGMEDFRFIYPVWSVIRMIKLRGRVKDENREEEK